MNSPASTAPTTSEPRSTARPRSAYVHIPFCAHKCGYCDFASLAGVDHLADRYLDALKVEIDRLGGPHEVDTIFIGGGTPTRLSKVQISRLLRFVGDAFPLAAGGEWTVEANPNTIDAARADALAEGGVNRVSLGAQSFRHETLVALERDHRSDAVQEALELVRPRFDHWSIDLIFGVPGSDEADWRNDLQIALELGVSHLSCYGLVFEKGTPLHKQLREGRVEPLDEEVERAMFAHTIDRLAEAGLDQYEISNFARPGHESRHNLAYWANDSYFGVGVGAARYVDGVRASNTRDLNAYLRRIEAGEHPTGPSEILEPEARARETAILNLRRTISGIDRGEFRWKTGFAIDDLSEDAIVRNVELGLLEDDGRRVRLSREGIYLADGVMCDFL